MELTFASYIYVILTYTAFLILIVGLAWKIIVYSKTPMCVKIALTPAPTTKGGVVLRLFEEVFFLKTLFRSNKATWIGSYIFHVSFAIVIIQHLLRHYVYDFYHGKPPAWYNILIPVGIVFGVLMLLSLLYLLYRRVFVERVHMISHFSDYFILVLLIAISVAGLSEIFFIPDAQFQKVVSQLDVFFNRLFVFHPANIPTNPIFLLHYTLVLVLLIYIPFSKLIHFIGIFFSPTLNMVDNPREKRYFSEKADRPTI